MTGKTLEEIINKWNKGLEEDVSNFSELCAEVNEWDKKILDNQDKVCLQHI